MCNYVVAIQMCMVEIMVFYVDESIAFIQDIFWNFKALCDVRHDAIPMSWVPKALDLNFEGLECLHFIPVTHSIQAIHQDSNTKTSYPVT